MKLLKIIQQQVISTPAVAGVVAAGIGISIWALLESCAVYLGAGSPQARVDGVFVILLSIQAGYFAAAGPVNRSAGQRCIGDLADILDGTDPQSNLLISRFQASGRIPRFDWTLPLGGLIMIVMQEAQFHRFSLWIAQPDFALGELWTVLAAWLTWTLALSAAVQAILDAAAMRRLGRYWVSVDLMRIEQLAAFSRYGLDLAGTVIGLMALWAVSLVLITSVAGNDWMERSNYIGVLMVGLYLSLAMTVFLFPQLGIRERIATEKIRICTQITNLLPSSSGTIFHAEANPERLAALLSSRSQIEALSEWPAGQHTRLKLFLYLLIPLLSWVAAALVEELVSKLLS